MATAAVQLEPSPLERRLVNAFVRTLFVRDRRGGPWSVPAHLPARPVDVPSFGGLTLKGLWVPAEKPRGTAVLAHPDRRYGKHWFVREGWVDFLHGHGYDVLAFDFPGYGETPGAPTYYPDHVANAARFARDWSGGFPVHLVGVSLGAFASAAAASRLPFVHGLVLESPYPSFGAWYGKGPGLWAMRAFEAMFPSTKGRIDAEQGIRAAEARRILVAYSPEDDVTPARLSEAVAEAAPPDRTRAFAVKGAAHLRLFEDAGYRAAILETLAGR